MLCGDFWRYRQPDMLMTTVMLTSDETTLEFLITKWFPSTQLDGDGRDIYEPLWTLLDQFYLINLSIECKVFT